MQITFYLKVISARLVFAHSEWDKRLSVYLCPVSQRVLTPSCVLVFLQVPPSTWEFLDAVCEGDIGTVRCMISDGADLNEPVENSPVHQALERRHPYVTRCLVLAGADVNAENWLGETALVSAYLKHEFTIMEMMLKHGADVNRARRQGQSLLHVCLQDGMTDIAEMLIRAGADVNEENKYGETAVISAFKSSLFNLLPAIYAAGADVNSLYGGQTLLHEALVWAGQQWCKVDVATKLIDAGADVNALNLQGEGVLATAFQNGHYGLIRRIIEAGADVNAGNLLHTALDSHQFLVAAVLIEAGADLTALNEAGETAFLSAFNKKEFYLLRLLSSKGADPDARNKDGYTPLMTAVTEHFPQNQIETLLACGADPYLEQTDNNGQTTTALKFAIQNCSENVVQLLVSRVDVNATDSLGETCVHAAVRVDRPRMIRALRDAGADMDKNSPLLLALDLGFQRCLKALIAAGADVRASLWAAFKREDHATLLLVTQIKLETSPMFQSPDLLFWAATQHNLRIGKMLLHTGTNINDSLEMAMNVDDHSAAWTLLKWRDPKTRLDPLVGANLYVWAVYRNYGLLAALLVQSGVNGNQLVARGNLFVPEVNRPVTLQAIMCLLDREWLFLNVRPLHRVAMLKDAVVLTRALLRHGAVLEGQVRYHSASHEFVRLVRAAGAEVEFIPLFQDLIVRAEPDEGQEQQQEEQQTKDTESLQHLTRETIRGHMMKVSKVNLFVRVPRLPLPKQVKEDLLYGESVEEQSDLVDASDSVCRCWHCWHKSASKPKQVFRSEALVAR